MYNISDSDIGRWDFWQFQYTISDINQEIELKNNTNTTIKQI